MKLFECQHSGQLLYLKNRGASEEICASPEPVSRDVTALDAPGSPGEAVGHLQLLATCLLGWRRGLGRSGADTEIANVPRLARLKNLRPWMR